jgi:hypothetical protein
MPKLCPLLSQTWSLGATARSQQPLAEAGRYVVNPRSPTGRYHMPLTKLPVAVEARLAA